MTSLFTTLDPELLQYLRPLPNSLLSKAFQASPPLSYFLSPSDGTTLAHGCVCSVPCPEYFTLLSLATLLSHYLLQVAWVGTVCSESSWMGKHMPQPHIVAFVKDISLGNFSYFMNIRVYLYKPRQCRLAITYGLCVCVCLSLSVSVSVCLLSLSYLFYFVFICFALRQGLMSVMLASNSLCS